MYMKLNLVSYSGVLILQYIQLFSIHKMSFLENVFPEISGLHVSNYYNSTLSTRKPLAH